MSFVETGRGRHKPTPSNSSPEDPSQEAGLDDIQPLSEISEVEGSLEKTTPKAAPPIQSNLPEIGEPLSGDETDIGEFVGPENEILKNITLTEEEKKMIKMFKERPKSSYYENFEESLRILKDVCEKIVKTEAPILNSYQIMPEFKNKDGYEGSTEYYADGRYPKRRHVNYSSDNSGDAPHRVPDMARDEFFMIDGQLAAVFFSDLRFYE